MSAAWLRREMEPVSQQEAQLPGERHRLFQILEKGAPRSIWLGHAAPRPEGGITSVRKCDIITTIMDAKQARERLLKEREQRRALAERLRAHEADAVEQAELSKVDQHPAELGTETFERERDLTALTILEGELADIQRALRRIEDGTYGTCEECGKPIGDERLEAKPWARFCIVHQAEMEKAAARR
jgi:RNA polymerase-binding transcription factor DksA